MEFKATPNFRPVFDALKQWRTDAMKAAKEGVDDALTRFHREFTTMRLQKRAEDSLGPRTRGLLESWKKKVTTPDASTVHGRLWFDGGKVQMIAQVQEYGAVIRAKRDYLKFRIYRKYSRRPWKHKKPEAFVQVKQVVIPGPTSTGTPGRLHFWSDWEKYEPLAWKIIEKARDMAVAKGRRMFA